MSQRSISSFFIPKAKDKTKDSLKVDSPESTVHNTSPKRTLESTEENQFSGFQHVEKSPTIKRPRFETQKDQNILKPLTNNANVVVSGKDKPFGISEQDERPSKVQKTSTSKALIRDRYSYNPTSSQAEEVVDTDVDDVDHTERELARKKLHERFVKKLGRPESMEEMDRRRFGNGDDELGVEDGDDSDGEEEPASKRPAKGGARKNGKLTPLEQQVVDIKLKHMDTLLVVEVGYKFRFFGEDARVSYTGSCSPIIMVTN